MQTELLRVTGMTCRGCVNSLTRALKAVDGVAGVEVLLATGETSVQYDEKLTSPEQIMLTVKNAGYGIVADEAPQSP